MHLYNMLVRTHLDEVVDIREDGWAGWAKWLNTNKFKRNWKELTEVFPPEPEDVVTELRDARLTRLKEEFHISQGCGSISEMWKWI